MRCSLWMHCFIATMERRPSQEHSTAPSGRWMQAAKGRHEKMETPHELDDTLDRCAGELEADGYALLPLNALLHRDGGTASIARAFGTARRALDAAAHHEGAAPLIDPSTDSGGWTGYHRAAVTNGRYNQHREGFVFSNGEMFGVTADGASGCNFEHEMCILFHIMHDIVADGCLRAVERRLELPNAYFQREVGPTHVASQWHMKRYVVDCTEAEGESTSQQEADILLPVHTDPSLISVVIIDRAGKNEGGMGLEVHMTSDGQSNSGRWEEISHHGHDVAIVFVGSVLSHLTKGQDGSLFSAAKHRVVNCNSVPTGHGRMAATLFVRPSPDALMKTLPSPRLHTDGVQKKPPTFRAWNARVAKNYMRKKKQRCKS